MANIRAHRRRRRRTNWQAAFWMLIIGIVIGFVLGIWLCAEYELLDVVGQGQIGLDLNDEPQVTLTEPPVTAQEEIDEKDEQEPTPKPLITPKVVAPTSAPVEPTPVPVKPTSAPVEPTPVPVEPTSAPVEPTLEPTAEPTAEPAAAEGADNGFGLASNFGGDEDEIVDEEPEPVMTDEEGNAVTREQYESGETAPDAEEISAASAEGQGETVGGPDTADKASGAAAMTQPRPRTDPVQPQEWFVFETEINAEGMPYFGNDSAGTVVALAMRVVDYMSPDDYAAQYADQYQLYGVEAAVAIEIRNDSNVAIVPDDALGIVLRDKADIPNDTYPLADAPMKASTDIAIAPGETVTVYKRYALNKAEGPYPFLSMAYMVGGETCRTYFLLEGME